MKAYFLFGFAVLIFACSNPKSSQNSSSRMTIPNDTLMLSGKTVVFFSISKPEYDSIVRDINSDIDGVLSDFNYYADALTDSIKAHGYEPVLSNSRYMAVTMDDGRTRVFDRCADATSTIGYLMSDGKQKPRISYDFNDDTDFLEDFRGFSEPR